VPGVRQAATERRWKWPHPEPGAPTWWRRVLFWFGKNVVFRWTLIPLTGGRTVYGVGNVPREGGAVLAANHISFADPPWVGSAQPRRSYFMAKRELFEVPIFGWIIHGVFAYPVDRGVADRAAIRYAIDLVSKGELLLIFPEGGRSEDGEVGEGGIAPAMVAGRAGVPIIPAAVVGTDGVLRRGSAMLHRHHTAVVFGEPIMVEADADGHLSRDAIEAATTKLMDRIRELRAWLLEREGERR
jgi:1-acyl-sn-glycerol-3-phosphate acyltransferase